MTPIEMATAIAEAVDARTLADWQLGLVNEHAGPLHDDSLDYALSAATAYCELLECQRDDTNAALVAWLVTNVDCWGADGDLRWLLHHYLDRDVDALVADAWQRRLEGQQ